MSTPLASQLLITTGPESCGKTTLATALGQALGAPVVAEVARDFLDARFQAEGHYHYSEGDLLTIARGQFAREQAALASNPAVLVCDTDLLVLLVWSEVRFGRVDPALQSLFAQSLAQGRRTYLLCDHRIPWVADPQREHPHRRPQLFERYRQELDARGLDYAFSSGTVEQRLQQALLLLQPAGCPCCSD